MPAAHIALSFEKKFDRLLGINSTDEQLRSQVRAQQVGALVRSMPGMMAGNALLGAMLLFMSFGGPIQTAASLWYAGILVYTLIGLKVWLGSRAGPARKHVSPRAVKAAATRAFLLGLIWSVAPFVFFNADDNELNVSLGICITGMLCVAGFVLATIPLVALSFLLPVTIGCLIVFAVQGTALTAVLSVILLAYILTVVLASYAQTRIYLRSIVVSATVEEQKKTISLLLKDFEAHSSDWLWETDHQLRIIRASERFAQAAGRSPIDLCGARLMDLFESDEAEPHPAIGVISSSLERQLNFTEIELPIRVNGEMHWWSLTGMAEKGAGEKLLGYHGVGSDVTFAKKADERISFLAHNDALTGLLNRAHFTETLNQTVSRLERYGAPFALMFLDLDHFKTVNDTRGHPVGDRLLIEVSKRLKALVPPGSVLARLGGDEFAMIVSKAAKAADVEPLAAAIVARLSEPFLIDGETINIGASVGIAIAPRHGTRSDQLLRNVDLALYRAKDSGRSAFRFFEISMDSQARERRALEFDLKSALQNDEFALYFQPLIGAESNEPSGFEALLRWNHPIRGLISPGEFIPIAENSGLIKAIGDWVLEQACMIAAQWPDHLTVAVNLSAPQFDNARIVETVQGALEKSGLAPHRLELEITESLLIDRPDDVIAILGQLRQIGVCIAMDDFGTGYSSLSYLLKFPYDKIKIDRSFVSAIETDRAACDVLKTIGSLAKTLNMRITAEGVETKEQVEFLRGIACDHLQGYYFARPLSAIELPPFLLGNFVGAQMPQREPKPANEIAA
jgi:diguanylate cyclase (GGDEF)-like protein/PAS domain S-box-containing protein